MRVIELENRCTGNRTVGSNPTLSAIRCLGPEQAEATVWLSPSGVYANRKSDWRPDKAVGPSPSLLARVRPDVRSRLCGCPEVRVVGRLRSQLRSSLRLTRPLDGAFLQNEVLLVDPALV